MKHRKQAIALAISIVLLGIFIMTTNPFELPLVFLLIPFVLLGVGCFMGFRLMFSLTPVSDKKGRYIAGVGTAIIMLVVSLQSIRQLSLRDFIILLALLVGLTFYLRRIDI